MYKNLILTQMAKSCYKISENYTSNSPSIIWRGNKTIHWFHDADPSSYTGPSFSRIRSRTI